MSIIYQCGGFMRHQKPASVIGTEDIIFTLDALRGFCADEPLQKPLEEITDTTTTRKSTRQKRGRVGISKIQTKKQKPSATAASVECVQCPMHCCHHCSLHCPVLIPTPVPTPIPVPPTPTPIPLPNPLPSPPTPGQPFIYVQVPTTYHGNVVIECIDRGNGNVELIGNTVPVNGKSLVIKCIDAQRVRFNINNMPTLLDVAMMPPIVLNTGLALQHSLNLKQLRSKQVKSPVELQSMKNSMAYISPFDIMFLTKEIMIFMNETMGITNVNPDHINFLASICNVPNLDNAFFTGYMVYGAGDRLFWNLTAADVACHEISHGVTDLEYRGESGALSESISDSIASIFEEWLFKKYNNDSNPNNNLPGTSNWTIGEVQGRDLKIIRNMKNPSQAPQPQPETYKGKYWQDTHSPIDDGGVHSNSGPANKFTCELCERIGSNVAIKVLYEAWKSLPKNAGYLIYRDMLKKSGATFNVLTQVQECLNLVGMTDIMVSDW